MSYIDILTKEYGVTVFAIEVWVSATENYKDQVKGAGRINNTIRAETHDLLFALEFFDFLCEDAYHILDSKQII